MAPEAALLLDGHLAPHSDRREAASTRAGEEERRHRLAACRRAQHTRARRRQPRQAAAGAARPLLAEQPEEASHRAETHRATLAGLIIAARSRAAADDGRPAACRQPAVVAGACV